MKISIIHNKPIETKLDAWLTFFGDDSPEKIMELISKFPEFKAMYETLFGMCHDVERGNSVKNKSHDLIVSQSKHSLLGYLFLNENK